MRSFSAPVARQLDRCEWCRLFAPRPVSRASTRRSVSRSKRIPTANSATRQDFSGEAKNHLTEDLIGARRSSTKRLDRQCFALQPAIRIRFPRAAVGKESALLPASTLHEYPYQVSPTESREASSAPNQLCEKHSGYILFSSYDLLSLYFLFIFTIYILYLIFIFLL